jgi:hypothetical protein
MPIEISASITLDTVIGDTYRQTGEDDYATVPVTFADAIVERCADKLMAKIIHDETSGYDSLRKKVATRATELIDARIAPLVEDVVTKGWTKTNAYGEPTGHTTTIREIVVEQIGKHLIRRPNARFDSDKSTFDKVLDTTIASVLAKELAAEVTAAKDVVRKQVAASASAVLSKAIIDGVTK